MPTSESAVDDNGDSPNTAEAERRQVLVDRVRRRVMNHTLAKAFSAWDHFLSERKHTRVLVHRVLCRFERSGTQGAGEFVDIVSS